ncbi:MAG: C4-dicarboxylate ABC transporter substrate-binding protein, partial [Polaromonas sp.]|nr:C4-dicarboxylate ABC transporter substrate-binding protein [Polaromonas sp.]
MKKFWMATLCAVSLGHASIVMAQTTWKLATGYRAESFHTQNIMQFSRDVEQATRGQLVVEVHPNNAIA